MKKRFIVIFTLLISGIVSAQSKSDFKKEFELLENKIAEITLKFEKSMGNGDELAQCDVNKGEFKDDEFSDEDFKDLEKEGGDFGNDDYEEENMKMFVKMYEENAKNGKAMYTDFSDSKDDKLSAKDKKYIEASKKYEAEVDKIEKKMYEVAKKYFSKK